MSINILMNPVNEQTAEAIFLRANDMCNRMIPETGYASAGFQAALKRDPILLQAMEKLANVIDKIAESQLGQTRRSATASFSQSIEPSQAIMVREAYRTMDIGLPAPNFGFLYAAVAEHQGLISAK